jgi:DNA replication and repair protein RecF
VQLSELTLHDVRSWKHVELAFDGSTAIIGGNGVGKTTLLEAAFYCATLSSFRTSSDQALIRSGSERAIIRATVRHLRAETIELEIAARGRSRAQLGGAPVSNRREILGVLRASIFGPEQQAIIRGEPGDRRRFVDGLLVMLAPRYHQTIREYERIVRQRNSLLRRALEEGTEPHGIEVWDEALLKSGAELCAGRARAIELLGPFAASAYDVVGDGGAFSIEYEARCEHPGTTDVNDWLGALRDKLEFRRDLERIRGTTIVGPHRDDLKITINELPARTHASHGEGWLAALALALGSHSCIEQTIGDPPVLLLDDPFTLLDPTRRRRLAEILPQAQLLVTAADPAEIPAELEATRIDAETLR